MQNQWIYLCCLKKARLVLHLIALLASLPEVSAGEAKTNILKEYEIKTEATLAGSQIVYRLSFMPQIGSDPMMIQRTGFTQSIKIFLFVKDVEGQRRGKGRLTFKILKKDKSIFERSRELTDDELSEFVKIAFQQEIFSLPKAQVRTDDLDGARSIMDASVATLERYDGRSDSKSTIVREYEQSGPFNVVSKNIYDLASGWFDEFVKENASDSGKP